MDLVTLYLCGSVAVVLYALFWTFVLDKNRPVSTKELFLKFLARLVFLLFIFSVLIGFSYFALGVFRGSPEG